MTQESVKPSVQPSLYRRGMVFYAKVKHLDGKWRNYNTRQTVRAHALVVAEDMQCRADRGLPVVDKSVSPETPASLISVRELAERFLKEYRRDSIKDLDAYRRSARFDLGYLLYPYLGDARAATLLRSDVKAYLRRLREEKSYQDGTLRVALGRLSVIYTWALSEGLFNIAHPCQGIGLGKKRPSEDHYTLDEIHRLLALPNISVMVVSALYTGMRRGELRALRWAWVDLDHLAIEVRGSYGGLPKNGRARTLPLHRELLPWLRRWQKECPKTPEGLVFPESIQDSHGNVLGWRMGRPQDTAELEDVLRRAEVHIPARPWHAMRHSLATHLAKATRGNLDVVSRILGHTTPGCAVTMGYVHTADLDYLAGELAKLSYRSAAPAKVVDLNEERHKRSGKKERLATDLLPRSLSKRANP